jgi:hypothetical protein
MPCQPVDQSETRMLYPIFPHVTRPIVRLKCWIYMTEVKTVARSSRIKNCYLIIHMYRPIADYPATASTNSHKTELRYFHGGRSRSGSHGAEAAQSDSRVLGVAPQARPVASPLDAQTAADLHEHRSPLMRTAEMCEEVRMDDVMEVKPYACPPWVARPGVVICEDEEQAQSLYVLGMLLPTSV